MSESRPARYLSLAQTLSCVGENKLVSACRSGAVELRGYHRKGAIVDPLPARVAAEVVEEIRPGGALRVNWETNSIEVNASAGCHITYPQGETKKTGSLLTAETISAKMKAFRHFERLVSGGDRWEDVEAPKFQITKLRGDANATAERHKAISNAIRALVAGGKTPPHTCQWEEFCNLVRDECDGWIDGRKGGTKHGYDIRTIQRLYKKCVK